MLGYLNVLIGGGLLLAGRKLFWLFVGALGFMLGLELAGRIPFRSEWVLVLGGLAMGALFALLAVAAETVAIGIAGFLGGGFGLMRLAILLGVGSSAAQILAFIVGGLLGIAFFVVLFDWALIVVSAGVGASLVTSGLFLTNAQRVLLFFFLFSIGILVQALVLRRDRKAPQEPSQPRS
jgi:hypothetical protein